MSHKIIRSIFEQRLAAWAADRKLRIAYQGYAFDQQPGETYLAAFTLPTATSTNTLSGDQRLYTGVFQINVVTPFGTGTANAEALVDELDTLFPAFLRLKESDFEVMVFTPVQPGPFVQADNTLTVSASFQYRADIH